MSKKPLQTAPKSLSNDYCVARAKAVGEGEREEGREGRRGKLPPLRCRGSWRFAGSLQSSTQLENALFSSGYHISPATRVDKRYPGSENSARILPWNRTGSSSQSWHTKGVSRGFPKCPFSDRWKYFLWKMLELFTSAKPASLYIVSHGRLGVLINPQPLHHLSFTPAYNKKTHFPTCLSMSRMESTLMPASALDENVQNTSLNPFTQKDTHET